MEEQANNQPTVSNPVVQDVEENREEKIPSKIEFESNGSRYILAFDRESVVRAEKSLDLSITEATSGKSSAIETVFLASLIKHHPNIKTHVALSLWDTMEDKYDLYKTLLGMYAACANSVLDEPEKGKGTSWKAV